MPIEIESPEQMGYASIKYNLTESSMNDVLFKDLKFDLKKLVLSYGDHFGKSELRKKIASETDSLNADNVLLTASAAAALFIVNTSLLEKNDHLIVVRPNYATNIETPRAMDCDIDFIDLSIKDEFKLDIEKLKNLIRPNTKLISLTTPHNPTGTMLSEEELKEIIKIAEEKNIFLLVDETYREMSFVKPPPLAASMGKNVISVSSVSKTYGLPGIRIGWIICRDEKLMENFLAAKEQIFICNSVVDEEIAFLFLKEKEKHLAKAHKRIRENYETLKDWLSKLDYLDHVLPQGGVVCFPRIKSVIDIEKFYKILNDKYSTYVGPGHWFEMDKHYFRIGFGWPEEKDLDQGLKNITKAYYETVSN